MNMNRTNNLSREDLLYEYLSICLYVVFHICLSKKICYLHIFLYSHIKQYVARALMSIFFGRNLQ